MELFCQYAVAATKEAIADAGLEMEKEDPYLVGTAIGSGVGSLQAIEREYKKQSKNLFHCVFLAFKICVGLPQAFACHDSI